MGAVSAPYNVVITAPVEKETILEVLEGADLYWVMAITVDEERGRVTVLWADDGERWDTLDEANAAGNEVHRKTVSWKKLADGLALVARGDFQNDPYQDAAAMGIIVNYAESDWDAWTGELMLQATLFGKLVYG